METQSIYHDGIITKLGKDSVCVEVHTQSACSGCHAKSACSMASQTIKTIQIGIDPSQNFQEKEEVIVVLQRKYGYWALFYAYILPLILVLSTLIIGAAITNNELTAGIYSIIVLIPYYLILFLSQKAITKKFNFKILKK